MAAEKEMEGEEEAPISGDILEVTLSHVPIIDLVSASHVSKSWNRAVFSSLRSFNRIKPWLIIHTQSGRSLHVTNSHAYDPRSHVWVEIQQPSINHISALRSSHSTLLYSLSASRFSFSFDPLHLTWHHACGPRVWRTDPIVAVVGQHAVVAGGVYDFEDDPLAVEIYDLRTRTWEACESMPRILKGSAAATWLSVAVNANKMYVAEKRSGTAYSFDPSTRRWLGPYYLRRDHENVAFYEFGFGGDRLIMVGLVMDGKDVEGVKMWEVEIGEGLETKELGEMPEELVAKLRGQTWFYSMEISCMGDYVYIHNPTTAEVVAACEIDGGGGPCRWWSVRNPVGNWVVDRLVLTCCNVGVADVQRALRFENRSFAIKRMD